MSYLIPILASLLLLASFLAWSWIETRQGFRVLAGPRRRFDRQVAKAAFVIVHIDWGAFLAHLAKSAAARVAHDIVHAVLLGVRAAERELTRTIRGLRERVARSAPEAEPVEGSPLISSIVRFRKSLRRDTPETK